MNRLMACRGLKALRLIGRKAGSKPATGILWPGVRRDGLPKYDVRRIAAGFEPAFRIISRVL